MVKGNYHPADGSSILRQMLKGWRMDKSSIDEIIEIVDSINYGKVEIGIEAGKVVLIKKTTNIKVSLSGPILAGRKGALHALGLIHLEIAKEMRNEFHLS